MKRRCFFKVARAMILSLLLISMRQTIFAFDNPEASNHVYAHRETSIRGLKPDQAEPDNLITKPYKVTATQTTIRTGPGSSFSSDGIIYKGDIIRVRSIDKGWAKFRVKSKWRYVKSTDIKKLG